MYAVARRYGEYITLQKLLNITKAARLFVLDRRAALLLIVIYDWVE